MQEVVYFFLFAVATANGQTVGNRPQPSERFPHFTEMGIEGRFWLYWKFDETHITFEMHGNTSGWVGVGFSPNGGMAGADIYVAWVKDGVARITDRHGADRNGFPPVDNEQNVELLSGRECDGWTMIKFRRQIPSCDESADWTLTTDTTRVIWAMGLSDPEENDITAAEYHGNAMEDRGVRSLLILQPKSSGSSTATEENTESFDLLSDGLNVPPVDTYYSCRLFKVPEMSSKRHIIGVRPLIEEANLAYVHHILVFQCSFIQPMNYSVVGESHECEAPNMPFDFRRCFNVIYGWAIGGGEFFFPDNVGLPLGEDDSPKYILTQTHYDNPGVRKGIVDSSGLRILHTDRLRKYDGGVLEVGIATASLFQLIPPNTASFQSYGDCPSVCIDEAMQHANRTDIRLIGGLLHSHLLGRKISLKHIASDNTTELPPIAQDNSYDFNYQEVKVFPKEIVFRRGESMQLVCEYDSRGRQNVTSAGLATSDEMCLAYVMYYPKVSMTSCLSFPFPANFYKHAFGIDLDLRGRTFIRAYLDNVTISAPEEHAGKSLSTFLNEIDWNEDEVKRFSKVQQTALRSFICPALPGLPTSGPRFGLPSSITQPYQAPTPSCIEPTDGKATMRNANDCSVMTTPGGASAQLAGNSVFTFCTVAAILLKPFC